MKLTDRLILFAFMVLAGVVAGGVVAAVLVPLCYSQRGHFAIGSEWFLIIVAAYAGYTAFNKYIFEKVERS